MPSEEHALTCARTPGPWIPYREGLILPRRRVCSLLFVIPFCDFVLTCRGEMQDLPAGSGLIVRQINADPSLVAEFLRGPGAAISHLLIGTEGECSEHIKKRVLRTSRALCTWGCALNARACLQAHVFSCWPQASVDEVGRWILQADSGSQHSLFWRHLRR